MSQAQNDLFTNEKTIQKSRIDRRSMKEELPRIDGNEELRAKLLPLCRLNRGEVWEDRERGHRVGVLDATAPRQMSELCMDTRPSLCVADPPYNVKVGARITDALFVKQVDQYDKFAKDWLNVTLATLSENSSLYVWLGADYKAGFHPIPEFCIEMRRHTDWTARNWITVRNQRGYGTQKNWMWVRQELLYYIKGNPVFNVGAEYTEIPKILRGYYKEVGGKKTENLERGKSKNIRAGNVWVDIQQIFYRLHENVPGCYAQKPIKAIERIISASSSLNDTILDPFSHSGTTLIAGEAAKRRILTCDIDPIYAEISIRRLEHFRRTGQFGWQCKNPFPELAREQV